MTFTTTDVFDKTDKGRDEIVTRQCQLAPRLRTLLLLVDGKRDTVELLAKVAGLGLDRQAIEELLENKFIERLNSSNIVKGLNPDLNTNLNLAPALNSKADSISQQVIEHSDERLVIEANGTPPAPVPLNPSLTNLGDVSNVELNNPSSTPSNVLRNGETQVQAVTNFFNETIRSVIGLRGFALQLKVERAATISELRSLREPYLEAVLKAKGAELERSLRNRLDQLLDMN